MRPAAALLRALSCKPPAPVAPWPPVRTAFDQWLTSELDNLRLHPHRYTSASWLSAAIHLAVAAQSSASHSISTTPNNDVPVEVEAYLDDTIDLLDACTSLRDAHDAIKTYTATLSVAAHHLTTAPRPSAAALARASTAFDSCDAIARRSRELDKCGSNLRKLGEKLAATAAAAPTPPPDDMNTAAAELREALSGSRAVALLFIGMLGAVLPFRSRRGVPAPGCGKRTGATWARAVHEMQKEMKEEVEKRRRDGAVTLRELECAASAAQRLRELVGRSQKDERAVRGTELRSAADEVRRRCGELEERIEVIGEGVEELYRHLISVRTGLLGLMSS